MSNSETVVYVPTYSAAPVTSLHCDPEDWRITQDEATELLKAQSKSEREKFVFWSVTAVGSFLMCLALFFVVVKVYGGTVRSLDNAIIIAAFVIGVQCVFATAYLVKSKFPSLPNPAMEPLLASEKFLSKVFTCSDKKASIEEGNESHQAYAMLAPTVRRTLSLKEFQGSWKAHLSIIEVNVHGKQRDYKVKTLSKKCEQTGAIPLTWVECEVCFESLNEQDGHKTFFQPYVAKYLLQLTEKNGYWFFLSGLPGLEVKVDKMTLEVSV